MRPLAVVMAAGLCLAALAPDALAQTRRALLIGINKYEPPEGPEATAAGPTPASASSASSASAPAKKPTSPQKGRSEWGDLDGAVNDVLALRDIFMARYGFRKENIRVLTDRQATREAILSAIRSHLLEPAEKGDVSVLVYAGHGSQLRTRSTSREDRESDLKDETLVPADSYRGAADIRDKEIRSLLNDILDKGALVTLIADSCHSGSIARGLAVQGKSRYLEPVEIDPAGEEPAKPDPRGLPQHRGAVILSSALSSQRAGETTDADGTPHGAFSLALIKTLRATSVTEPAQRVYLRARALMQANGLTQQPDIQGDSDRPLFGPAAADVDGRTFVAVERTESGGTVVLQGGLAIGLRPGTELVALIGDEAKGDPPRLRVESVEGMSLSRATVVLGSIEQVASGDLYTVDRWVADPGQWLRLWVPPATMQAEALSRAVTALAPLRASERLDWIHSPTGRTPTYVASWSGGDWRLGTADSRSLRELLESEPPAPVPVFVQLPPFVELAAELEAILEESSGRIEVVSSPEQAHYLLVGRLGSDAGVEYAWIRPNDAKDGGTTKSPLPLETDWLSASVAANPSPEDEGNAARLARQLVHKARLLAKIRAFHVLESPPGQDLFPYSLEIRSRGTPLTGPDDRVIDGAPFEIVLTTDKSRLDDRWQRRFIYLFTVDTDGVMQLLFPTAALKNEGNLFPQAVDGAYALEIELCPSDMCGALTAGEPFGTDTFFLLTSREPILDLSVFSSPGVRTHQTKTRGLGKSPLQELFELTGSAVRGVKQQPVPTNWSIERIPVTTAPRPGPE